MSQSAHARVRAPRHRPGAGVAVPPGPRRVSGPVRRPASAAAPPAPRRTTSAFDRVRALPDHRLLDSLLRSSAWIWVIGIALGGIVAMQVSLLKLNAGIGRAVESASTLERQNAALELSVARLSSGARIESNAAANGMVTPAAGAVEFVRVRPGTDARWAAERMTSPSPAATALLANNGIVPGSLATPPVEGGVAPPATASTTTVPTTQTAAPQTGPAPVVTAPAGAHTTAPATAPTTAPTTATAPAPAPAPGG